MRYRTKPCEIEAIEWTGRNQDELKNFGGESLEFASEGLYIQTLEGRMKASIGDFIIKGLRGEFYPCKPDVFHKKYQEVDRCAMQEL